MEPSNSSSPRDLAGQARQVFLRHVMHGMDRLGEQVREHLLSLLDLSGTMAEVQDRRDLYHQFQQQGAAWLRGVRQRLEGRGAARQAGAARSLSGELSLVAEDAVETQILSARAALAAIDKGSGDFNDLRLRLQHLDHSNELDKHDPVQALGVAESVVDAWLEVGFTREQWLTCQAVLQSGLAEAVATGYREANAFLLSQGVLPAIDLRGLLRRAPEAVVSSGGAAAAVEAVPVAGAQAAALRQGVGGGVSSRAAFAGGGSQPVSSGGPGMSGTRLMALLGDRVPAAAEWLRMAAASAGEAGAPHLGAVPSAETWRSLPPVDWSSLEAGAAGLRAQTRALKAKVSTDQEKAIIEVVALIFDSILTEDRIPPSLRVWFARLQMPVLRHAMSDPAFLASDKHPARLLIDRMGSCVMGFDPSVSMAPLEQEIKRIVQVIEQYPETGRRVFELMYKEFLDFLGKNIQQSEGLRQIADVAQRLEQKEALTVQYIIELRKLLGQAVLRDTLRDFLYQVWAEVMAQGAVTYGVTDTRAQRLRQAATDLLWASSAKSTRQERAQVIARVPGLLATLREGMGLLGYDKARQDAALKPVNDTLADAFMSRTPVVDTEWLGALTRTLGQVEEYLPDGDEEGLPFDRESLEMITGTDASAITVLPDTDAPVRPEARKLARKLALGSWFRLEHNGVAVSAQLAWQSPRRQLYLFATSTQDAYLLQQGRVAQYLHAGLLVPVDGEGLIERATRDAVAKLDANPERLLS